MNRQELIEEVAKAVEKVPYHSWHDVTREGAREIACAALAVFEQAHTPTDDEREAARAYADAEYPELLLAPENEDKADIAERAFLAGAGFRRAAVQEPSAEESDLPDGHAPAGQLSPFLSRRVQSEPTDNGEEPRTSPGPIHVEVVGSADGHDEITFTDKRVRQIKSNWSVRSLPDGQLGLVRQEGPGWERVTWLTPTEVEVLEAYFEIRRNGGRVEQ